MIGHYLLTLSEEEEGRVLVTPMGEGGSTRDAGAPRCIVQAALGMDFEIVGWERPGMFEPFKGAAYSSDRCRWIPGVYDNLVARFGAPRVNAAIRARILTNRLWRTLQAPQQSAVLSR